MTKTPKTSKGAKPPKTKTPRAVPDMLQVPKCRALNIRADMICAKLPDKPTRAGYARKLYADGIAHDEELLKICKGK